MINFALLFETSGVWKLCFTFFLFFFFSFSTAFSQPSYLLLEILNAERRFLKFRDWKCFKGLILIFQFDRHVKFAIRGAIVWKIRMENHGKSYSSFFTIFSLFLSPFLFIVFIKRTFSLSYPWRRTKKLSRLGSKGNVERYYSHSSVGEEKPPPFISSIIATGTLL